MFRIEELERLLGGMKDGGSVKPTGPSLGMMDSKSPPPLSYQQDAAPAAPPEHKGMFGIHGKARDILGLIGDAFLVQGGGKPLYQAKRAQERDSDAMQGFVSNPLAAAQRLAQEGQNPEAARKFYNDVDTQQRLQRAADQDYQDKVLGRTYSMLSASLSNPKSYPAIRSQAQAYLKSKGVELPGGASLPDVFDEDALRSLATSGIPVNQQIDDAATAAWRDQQMNYRDRALGERAGYHEGVLGLGKGRLQETGRHNVETEGQGRARVSETGRHNVETEGNTRRGQDKRDATTRRGQDMTPMATMENDFGDVVVGTRGGTLRTYRDSHPTSAKEKGRKPIVRREAAIPHVTNAADYAKIPAGKGAKYVDPSGKIRTKP